MTAESIIEKLNLARHPEGGFYRETYRAEKSITLDDGRIRSAGTAIYYLLKVQTNRISIEWVPTNFGCFIKANAWKST